MSTASDLADWGEAPTTVAESDIAEMLEQALARMQRGQAPAVLTTGKSDPEMRQHSQSLVGMASLVLQCATSVWETADLIEAAPANAAAADPAAADALPDPFPGEFRLCRLLGTGGFGRVWLADDLMLGRPVALKTLKTAVTTTAGPAALAALRAEAQHLAQLRHAHIVQVHAWREAHGEHYLVLQYVDGGSLAQRLQTVERLDWQSAARYVADVGDGLLAAHARSVVHRDIKPANILWDAANDEALLTDFGVAAHLAEAGTPAGTPVYMAPEAFDGHLSPALDVYSLAATLFTLVTGTVPFGPAPTPVLLLQIRRGLPEPDPRCAAMPKAMERVVRAGLSPDPKRRPSLGEFVALLRATLNQLLADALVPPPGAAKTPAPVTLHIVVSRQRADGTYQPVAAAQPPSEERSLRDMRRVPPAPPQVTLQTGDRVRIEVTADQDGYLTVFNVGPTGNLNLLYPDDPAAALHARIQRDHPLHVVDVEMEVPAGRERLFAVWSATPLLFRTEQLRSLAESGTAQPYRVTRDMKRIQESLEQRPPGTAHVVVLELDHVSP